MTQFTDLPSELQIIILRNDKELWLISRSLNKYIRDICYIEFLKHEFQYSITRKEFENYVTINKPQIFGIFTCEEWCYSNAYIFGPHALITNDISEIESTYSINTDLELHFYNESITTIIDQRHEETVCSEYNYDLITIYEILSIRDCPYIAKKAIINIFDKIISKFSSNLYLSKICVILLIGHCLMLNIELPNNIKNYIHYEYDHIETISDYNKIIDILTPKIRNYLININNNNSYKNNVYNTKLYQNINFDMDWIKFDTYVLTESY